MNPLTGLSQNQDYVSQYQKLSVSFSETKADSAGNIAVTEFSAEYTKQTDSVEISAAGKKMLSLNESLKILYSSTTAKIDAAMTTGQEAGGVASTDAFASLSDYFNPENTAQRIVDFAASFFADYTGNHAEETGTAKLQNDFKQLMRDAIDQGFKEAQQMLSDFYQQDTPGFITDTISETYDLVQKKLDALTLQ